MDHFIAENVIIIMIGDAAVHLLKVDTQGFEPYVFSGLARSILFAVVDYIIFEFWPRGMDLAWWMRSMRALTVKCSTTSPRRDRSFARWVSAPIQRCP